MKQMYGDERYMVAKDGTVTEIKTGKQLIPRRNDKGLYVQLLNLRRKDPHSKRYVTRYIHSIVFETFKNRKVRSGYRIDFLNGDKYDCSYGNLKEVKSYKTVAKDGYNSSHKHTSSDVSWMGGCEFEYMGW